MKGNKFYCLQVQGFLFLQLLLHKKSFEETFNLARSIGRLKNKIQTAAYEII